MKKHHKNKYIYIGTRKKNISQYKKHHKNKYIYIIYTQNYAIKCTIKYITTAYISKLLIF